MLTRILSNWPLKGDSEESAPICTTLIHMTNKNPPLISQHLEAVLKIMVETVLKADENKMKEFKAVKIKDYLLKASQDTNASELLKGIINQLDPDMQKALQLFLEG